MKIETIQPAEFASQLPASVKTQALIIAQLKEQHANISEKLLPEIDLHFWALLKNNNLSLNQEISTIYKKFLRFQEHLNDHFFMEEIMVFPSIQETKDLGNVIEDFINKHDNYELILAQMLIDIETKLAPISELLSLRILLLKIERLSLMLEEHQALEDNLFVELLN